MVTHLLSLDLRNRKAQPDWIMPGEGHQTKQVYRRLTRVRTPSRDNSFLGGESHFNWAQLVVFEYWHSKALAYSISRRLLGRFHWTVLIMKALSPFRRMASQLLGFSFVRGEGNDDLRSE